MVWEDSRFSGTHNDIAMAASNNEGRTWTKPVKVNQTPGSATRVHACGRHPAQWHRRSRLLRPPQQRSEPATTLFTDNFIADSHDGGATWSEARLTRTSFDDTFAPVSRGYFLGDYQGLTNDGTNFKSFFVKTNSDTTNRTDVFGSTVTP